jgi:hypothetical protein
MSDFSKMVSYTTFDGSWSKKIGIFNGIFNGILDSIYCNIYKISFYLLIIIFLAICLKKYS